MLCKLNFFLHLTLDCEAIQCMDKILGEYMIICKNNLQKQAFLIMSFMESNHGCLS